MYYQHTWKQSEYDIDIVLDMDSTSHWICLNKLKKILSDYM